MDFDQLRRAITEFIARHQVAFASIGARHSQLLEVAALTVASQHYATKGYTVTVRNIHDGVFRVKQGSRGSPWNFSWFEATAATGTIEIHANLPVRGAYGLDGAVYVVDVAIVRVGAVPIDSSHGDWASVANEDLVTFIEAKAIAVYPMLVAQFLGIVGEIRPELLGYPCPKHFDLEHHHYPALVSLGSFSAMSRQICSAFPERQYWVRVIPNFDTSFLATAVEVGGTSPFDDPASPH